jgi:hypothetical protein
MLGAFKDYATWAASGRTKTTERLNEFNSTSIPSTSFIEEFNANIAREMQKMSAEGADPAKRGFKDRLLKGVKDSSLGDKAVSLDQFMQEMYHHEDAMWKFMLFDYYRSAKGLSVKQSEALVQRYMFDWTNAPLFIQKMRFIPFSPSVLWQYGRVIGNVLRDKPGTGTARIAMMMLATNMARNALDEMTGTDRESRPDLRWADMVLPIVGPNGKYIKWSASRLVPFSDINRLIPQNVNDLPATLTSLSPMLGRPFLDMLNVGPFGRKVWDKEDENAEALKKLSVQLVQDAIPGLLTNVTRSIAAAQTPPWKRNKREWWEPFFRSALGIESDIDNSEYYRR